MSGGDWQIRDTVLSRSSNTAKDKKNALSTAARKGNLGHDKKCRLFLLHCSIIVLTLSYSKLRFIGFVNARRFIGYIHTRFE